MIVPGDGQVLLSCMVSPVAGLAGRYGPGGQNRIDEVYDLLVLAIHDRYVAGEVAAVVPGSLLFPQRPAGHWQAPVIASLSMHAQTLPSSLTNTIHDRSSGWM
jgi:hypothetical protein